MGMALATPPLPPPIQYEQFCEEQKVAGTGVVDVSTSIIDKKIALEYYNVMNGDGDLELDQTHVYSQRAEKINRSVPAINGTKDSRLNLYETTKMTYAGETPLVGGKYLHSKAFYGGIGADIQEMFAVNEMEKDQTTFFASTHPLIKNVSPEKYKDEFQKMLRDNRTNENNINKLMDGIPAHLIGIDTKNAFNGTWGTDAKWHKIFYKDIKAHEMFTGKFEAEKMIKFHEYPVPEMLEHPCAGVDC
jgi:hypothetical protein